jgi:hypothetical protein
MDQKRILIDYLMLKISLEDWRSVEDAARDLRALPQSPRVHVTERSDLSPKMDKPEVPLAAVPPVEMKIPHNASEVVNLLRLNDEDLVDRLFPDYTQIEEGNVNANA